VNVQGKYVKKTTKIDSGAGGRARHRMREGGREEERGQGKQEEDCTKQSKPNKNNE
jgi:hypothetical protein